jgi:PilZ domain
MSKSGEYLPDHSQLSALRDRRDASYAAGTSLDAESQRARRRHLRAPVEACRPVAIQFLDEEGQPACGWTAADILDVSLGGFCLLITEDKPLPIAQLMRLHLDVTPHPAFGVELIPGELRWFVRSGFVLSIGVGFDEPLSSIPALLPCRRAVRRDLEPDRP